MNKVLKLTAAALFIAGINMFATEAAAVNKAVEKIEAKAAKTVEEKKADANKTVEKAAKKVETKAKEKMGKCGAGKCGGGK